MEACRSRERMKDMGRNIRFGVAAAAVLAFVPAWGAEGDEQRKGGNDSQSYSQRIDALEARLARLEATLDQLHAGSGSGEPARTEEDRRREQQREAANQRFLNEIWNNP